MRAVLNVAVIAAAAMLCASCNTFRVAGVRTFGRVHDVSVADVEAAIATFKASQITKHLDVRISEIEVISRDAIRIYWSEAVPAGIYTMVNRVRGRWTVGDTAIPGRE